MPLKFASNGFPVWSGSLEWRLTYDELPIPLHSSRLGLACMAT
jgi:hypothetical protein